MSTSPLDSEHKRIPFGEFFPEIVEATKPAFFPTMVWGYFETETDEGETGWVERTSADASYSTILSQISGYLVEVEGANAWLDDQAMLVFDSDVNAQPVTDLSGDVLNAEASAALSRLMIHPLPDGHELTGRYVALICDDDPFESDNVELLSEDASSELIEGLLRIAQARFAETLSFSPFDDDTADEDQSTALETADMSVESRPAMTTFGELFDGWSFLPLPDDVDVSAVWSLVLAIDADDIITWYARRTPVLDENVLAGGLARMAHELEAELMDSFDHDDEEPSRLTRGTLPELTTLVADTSPSRPLDPRIATLATRALPNGQTPIVATLLLFGTDQLGSSSLVIAREMTSDTVALGDAEVDGFEELGLIRSALRDILQHGLGEF